MSADTLDTVLWAANCAQVAWRLHGPWGPPSPPWRWFAALIAVAGLVVMLAYREWAPAGFCAATLILLLRDWWNRKGRKAARQLGAKSLAVLAAVVERAREAGTPVPQGVPG